MLVAFRSPSPLAGVKELPSRIQIGKWGRNESVRGAFTVNERTAQTLPRMQAALGFDTVALDFEHQTVPAEDGKRPPEPIKVAAHGRPIVVPGAGLFLDDVQWTPEGQEAALGGHYPDLSPAVKMNDAGEVLFVHSAALCRQGSVPDLQLFSAALTDTQLKAFSAPAPSTTPVMDYKKLLLLMLGLAETATDADIETGAKAFAAKFSKADLGKLESFSADLQKLKETHEALLKRLDTAERQTLVAQAVAAGKIVPHGADIDKLDNAAFAAVLAALPADQVPMDQRTPEGIKTFSASLTSDANSADDAVRQQLGISKETWDKHNKAA